MVRAFRAIVPERASTHDPIRRRGAGPPAPTGRILTWTRPQKPASATKQRPSNSSTPRRISSRPTSSRRLRPDGSRLLYLLASLALFAFLTGPDDGWRKILVVTLSWLGFAVLGGFLQWAVYVPWRARRVYARYPLAKIARRFSLREDGLQMRNERGDITMLWSDFTRWRANRRTILLYTSPGGAFMLVPARLAERGFPIEGLKAALRRELGPPRR